MAPSKNKFNHSDELKQLEPSLQIRVRRTLWIAGVWGGLVLLGGISLALAKPYLTKKRLERMKQPGYKPYAVPKRPVYVEELKKRAKKDD